MKKAGQGVKKMMDQKKEQERALKEQERALKKQMPKAMKPAAAA